MALPLNDSISIYRGDDFSRTYQIATGTASNAVPVNLTGCVIASQLRKTEGSAGSPLATFNVTNRVDLDGTFTLTLSNAITAALRVSEAVFDVQFTNPAGKVTTYIKGTAEVVADVTRAGS
jgi:hypothetical protein